jgi:hypothetical protein
MEKADIQILHHVLDEKSIHGCRSISSLIIFKSLENRVFNKNRVFQPIHIKGKKNNSVIA